MTSGLSYPHNEGMNSFIRLPLYLGVSIFALSVILSGISISDKNYRSRTTSQAGQKTAVVSLIFSKPDLVSVAVNSPEAIAGVDVTITFDPTALEILPSTLMPGPYFTTTGGGIDKESEFIFSALASETNANTSGIVATFQVKAKKDRETILSFDTADDKTSVIAQYSQKLIPLTGKDLTLKLSP